MLAKWADGAMGELAQRDQQAGRVSPGTAIPASIQQLPHSYPIHEMRLIMPHCRMKMAFLLQSPIESGLARCAGVCMFRILKAGFIAPGMKRFVIEAPRIARKHQAGQFVILRLHEQGERIPLTIESADAKQGTITIVVQSIGKTTNQLNALEAGDGILDVVGPLGKPSVIKNFGTVVIIGGGVGTALAYPTTVALKRAGNRIVTILGGRNRDLVILEDEMRR